MRVRTAGRGDRRPAGPDSATPRWSWPGAPRNDARAILLEQARGGYRLGNGTVYDSLIRDGLWCAMTDVHMGTTAENIATEFGITREDQDAFAAESQHRAVEAIAAGRFVDEIVPVSVAQRRGAPLVVTSDEHPRPDTTRETLAGLRPAFDPGGTVTAGNASGINDGAAAVLVMDAAAAGRFGITPLATVRSWATAGVPPRIMGMGPGKGDSRTRTCQGRTRARRHRADRAQ